MLLEMPRPPGSRDDPPPQGPEGHHSSFTQRMPQMLVEPSNSFGVSALVPAGDADGLPTQPTLARPRLIVLEEMPLGIAEAFARMGFLVRTATTGVEVLSMCTQQAPVAVVVGPGDLERRRVLTSALRLRFGGVAVVYVVMAGESARADGASAVLPWPLPAVGEVMRAIPWHADEPLAAPSTITRMVPPSAGMRARSIAPELRADASETGPVDVRHLEPRADADGPATLVAARAALSAVQATEAGVGGHSSEVWREAAPLMWRLDEAARFLDELALRVTGAAEHADTVRAAARWMAAIQHDPER
jgi:hypothetical protein